MNRRNFLKKTTFVDGVSSIGGLLTACSKPTDTKPNMPKATETAFLMPEESEPHTATWMAFGATAGAWGTTDVYGLSCAFARADLMP